jgi:hypothetical protein
MKKTEKYNEKKLSILLPLILFIVTACAVEPTTPEKTPLEIRELQTRSYDTKDTKMVLKAVMNALQDDNFIIQQANMDLGLLSAQKEVEFKEENGEFSWGTALAIGAVAIAVGAAIILSNGKSSNSNSSSHSSGGGADIHVGKNESTFKNTAITEASANISEFGEKTRVRINFQVKVLDNHGGTAEVKQIQDGKFYQTFFSKVDKAVFLAQEKLQ